MLDEYILSKLDDIAKTLKILEKQLDANIKKQIEYNEQINKLTEAEDPGMELFSPRNAVNSSSDKISETRLLLEELQLAEAKLRDDIEYNRQKEAKLKTMMEETRIQTTQDDQHDNPAKKSVETTQEARKQVEKSIKKPLIGEDELTLLLKKVETAKRMSLTDPVKCCNELDNICYYIKALITRSE